MCVCVCVCVWVWVGVWVCIGLCMVGLCVYGGVNGVQTFASSSWSISSSDNPVSVDPIPETTDKTCTVSDCLLSSVLLSTVYSLGY